jgi:hypothetical protein
MLTGQKCLVLFFEPAVGAMEGPFNNVIDNLDDFQQCLESVADAVLKLCNELVQKNMARNLICALMDMHMLNKNQCQARKSALVDA